MTKVPSFTFAGGVLSENLHGRYDLNKYQTGLKSASNVVLSVEGGIEKRWGTYYTGARKDQSDAGVAKLIPWRIADDDSYMLEFGDNYIRFIRLGGYVTIPGGWVHDPDNIAANVGGFMEVPTPWSASAARELKYTFANDIMYIAHSSARPHQLQRLSLYDWNLIEQEFDPHPDWSGTVTGTYHDDTTADDNYDTEPAPIKYKVSATLEDGIETKASPAETVSADLGHRRTRVDLDWPNYTGAIQYTIYKGANGIYGFIGYSQDSDYTDRNYAPSFDVVPIGDIIGFGGPLQNPSVIEFYKQRMAYAATQKKSQDIWFSRPLIFNSLTKSIPLQDDDAFQLPLVGRERHKINHMLMLKKFLIFTDTAEWTLNTVENRALTAATADPVIETYYGAHPWLRPLSIGNRVLFVQNKTGAILDMGYEFASDAFKADDLTRLVRSLFKGKEIVAWDYAVHPQNTLFVVLNDGTLNIMTYVREHEIWGWTTATTEGKYLDVACVTETNHEGVYFQIERVIDGVTKRFIERLDINFSERLEDMIYSDCALSYYDKRDVVIDWVSSGQIKITTPDFSVNDLVRIELSSTEYYQATVTAVAAGIATLVPDGERTLTFPDSLEGASATAFIMTDTVAGADHLEGATIWALADGKVYKDIVVSSGGFTLPTPAARIHFGIPFSAQIETLDMDADPVKGQFREKTIHELTINVQRSRGISFGVGSNYYELDKVTPRNSVTNMYDANAPLNGSYDLRPHIVWGNTTEVVLRSDDPLPMTILNICPDVRYGSS